ncbi:hypothetical protein BC829DRAFT_40312 [Chytridium lagenaria]|nr:hypothetical protein BC829DRAFT_40312 [Chytridium lagenaria]
MHVLSFFIGLLALSAPISGLSISATRQELINNEALLADAATSIESFASSLGSDEFTLDAATSMEFLSDVADFVSLGSQQISALQAHPFVRASPYSQESLQEAEMIFDELASDIASEYQGLVSDDVRTNEVSSRLVRRGRNRDAAIRKVAGDAATKIREKTGITTPMSPSGQEGWSCCCRCECYSWGSTGGGAHSAAAALTKALRRGGKGKQLPASDKCHVFLQKTMTSTSLLTF